MNRLTLVAVALPPTPGTDDTKPRRTSTAPATKIVESFEKLVTHAYRWPR
jgi:hypothetical protein